jgi:hypothetical protein
MDKCLVTPDDDDVPLVNLVGFGVDVVDFEIYLYRDNCNVVCLTVFVDALDEFVLVLVLQLAVLFATKTVEMKL